MRFLNKVLASCRRIWALLRSQLNAIVFGTGACLVGYGVSLWSRAASLVLLGSLLMIVAAWPFLRLPMRKKA